LYEIINQLKIIDMENYESMDKALSDLKKSGYEADLDFETDSFCLYCSDLDMRLNPTAYHVDATIRIEGETHADDTAVVYAISSCSGIKGTLVDAHDADAGSPLKQDSHEPDRE
jgi:hypothetical protein